LTLPKKKFCAKKPVAQGLMVNPAPATGGAPTQEVDPPVKLTVADPGTAMLLSVTSVAL